MYLVTVVSITYHIRSITKTRFCVRTSCVEFGETDYTHLKLLKRLKDYNILTITVIIELIHFFVGFEDGFNKQFNHD